MYPSCLCPSLLAVCLYGCRLRLVGAVLACAQSAITGQANAKALDNCLVHLGITSYHTSLPLTKSACHLPLGLWFVTGGELLAGSVAGCAQELTA
jgi:hypothetical protein